MTRKKSNMKKKRARHENRQILGHAELRRYSSVYMLLSLICTKIDVYSRASSVTTQNYLPRREREREETFIAESRWPPRRPTINLSANFCKPRGRPCPIENTHTYTHIHTHEEDKFRSGGDCAKAKLRREKSNTFHSHCCGATSGITARAGTQKLKRKKK